MQNLIDQIEAQGLIQVKHSRKVSTGVHRFFDPRTEEIYDTYNTGYVRRTSKTQAYFNPNLFFTRNAPINKTKRVMHPNYNFYSTEQIMILTETERLQYLLDYMKRKNKRLNKQK